jgi:hypothetical protein
MDGNVKRVHFYLRPAWSIEDTDIDIFDIKISIHF